MLKVHIMFSLDLHSGIVVDVGEGVATCAVVWNRELLNNVHCSAADATPEKLAGMVQELLIKFAKNEEKVCVLKDGVVLTGLLC